jgi:hypothetical protein
VVGNTWKQSKIRSPVYRREWVDCGKRSVIHELSERETPQSERAATSPVSEFKMRLRFLTPRSFGLQRRTGSKVTWAEGEVMSSDDDSSEDSQAMHTPSCCE